MRRRARSRCGACGARRALATIAGGDAPRALGHVLDDPFWRVRYAAIQALATLPPEQALFDVPRSERSDAAVAFLRAIRSGERAVDVPERADAEDADDGDAR